MQNKTKIYYFIENAAGYIVYPAFLLKKNVELKAIIKNRRYVIDKCFVNKMIVVRLNCKTWDVAVL